jgi:hypothetical protein
MRKHVFFSILIAITLAAAACGDDSSECTAGAPGCLSGSDGGTDSSTRRDASPPPPPPPAMGFPEGNEWSWDGSWTPADGDFPLDGLFDDEYGDGHDGTPVLPPGVWDWEDANDDLANWRNFESNLGTFEPLMDSMDRQYGWRFVGLTANTDYQGAADYFEGSSGVDYMDLGPAGTIHSFGAGNLAGGPDVLIFDGSYSLDFRTGTTADGGQRDNDLVIAGCRPNSDGAFEVATTTIHTGPGHDWVFVRDIERAGIDLGNGDGGRTDTIDISDGNDMVVLRGNTLDFRVMGGAGDDVFVWYVDENIQTSTWLGPNFFGGGGWGTALFSEDAGVDRLVLVIPTDTEMVTSTPTPAGGLLVRANDGELIIDEPTADDDYGRYCQDCGMGPGGEKTIIVEYNSADGMIETGYFYLTDVDELQVGIGDGARVYALDAVTGTATLIEGAEPTEEIVPPPELCD